MRIGLLFEKSNTSNSIIMKIHKYNIDMNRHDAIEEVWTSRLTTLINTGNNEAILEKHFNATSPKEQKSIIEDIYDGKNQVAQERKLKAIGIPFDHLPDMPNIYFAKIAYSKLYDHTEYVNCNNMKSFIVRLKLKIWNHVDEIFLIAKFCFIWVYTMLHNICHYTSKVIRTAITLKIIHDYMIDT